MKTVISSACHAAVLLLALRWSHSTSGFLITGVGLCLFLDRYCLRLLPWRPGISWFKEIALRCGSFLVGSGAFFLMRPGIVPIWEAAYRGAVVALVAFFLGVVVGLAQALSPSPGWKWRARWLIAFLFVAGIAFAIPLLAALHPLHTVPKRTPAAFGLSFDDIRFRSADGVKLAGWVVPCEDARGNVIFCHGHGRNRGHVAGILPTLHDLRLNVLAFDFRGHGDSEGHTSTFGQREVQDLRDAAAYFQLRFPDRPLILVGVSLGAAVCLQTVADLPAVCGVWSEGAFSRFDEVAEHQFAWVPTLMRKRLMWLYEEAGWLDCGLWGPDINPIDRLAGLSVPICFCHAGRDQLVPPGEGRALHDAYAGPKWHWWITDAGHYNIRQRHPEEYAQRLRNFVDECLRSRVGKLHL